MMAREFDMCEICKLDKAQKCDYTCVKRRSDFRFRFYTYPNFLYDDGNLITNAERISTLLKLDSDSAADEIRNETMLNDEHIEYHDFRGWLREESE